MVGVVAKPKTVVWWIDGMRRCQTCKKYQDRKLYGKNVKSDDGLSPICKPCLRERELKKKYGMTNEDYNAMLAAQKGGCAICGITPREAGKSLAVDHDHRCCGYRRDGRTCGRCTRQLLCESCNLGIGKFNDDPDLLRKALAYLEEWQ